MQEESVDNMANGSGSRGIHVTPGSGIVAHLGLFMAYAEGDDDGLNQLVVRLNALAGAPWSEVVRTLTSDIAAAGYDNHPSLACATIEGDRLGVLVFGDLTLSVVTDQEQRILDGRHSSTWIDLAVPGAAQRVRCGVQSESTVVGVLRDGVVSGGGFVFDLHGPIPAATRWDADETAVEPQAVAAVVEAPAEPAPESDEPMADPVAIDEPVVSDPIDEPAVAVEADASSIEDDIDEVLEEMAGETDAALPEADDEIVDAQSLNGSIFGSSTEESAPEIPTVDEPPAGDDFPAVAGIFSRSGSDAIGDGIDDAEVVDEPLVPEPVGAPEFGAGAAEAAVDPAFLAPETMPIDDGAAGDVIDMDPNAWPEPDTDGVETVAVETDAVAEAEAPAELDDALPPPPPGSSESIDDAAGDVVPGPRQSLGTLTFDDGAQLQLTRPVVIGRGVPERYVIHGEPATTVLLDDVQGTISRVHVEVHLVGSDVQILDMNSTSGTFVRTDEGRHRLLADDPTVIAPDTVVELGQRSFTFSAGPLPAA